METTPTPNTQLSHESQAAIRKMLLLLDALCGNNSLWKYEELERAMEQMFNGDFSTPTFSRPRLKLAYLIIRRQILHLLTLESSIQQERAEWKKERENLLKETAELKERAAQKEKSERKEEKESITPTPQSSRHIITPKPFPTVKESPRKAKNSPPATQWKGGVPRSGEVVSKMPKGITHQLKGIPPPKDKQLKINSPPISIKNPQLIFFCANKRNSVCGTKHKISMISANFRTLRVRIAQELHKRKEHIDIVDRYYIFNFVFMRIICNFVIRIFPITMSKISI